MTSSTRADQGVSTDAVERADRHLRVAAVVFLVTAGLHDADHLRRGFDATPIPVQGLGAVGSILTVVAVVMVLRRHHLAPLVAVAAGVGLAIGFVAVHWLPSWGEFSDSLLDGDAQVATQVASLLEVAGAAGLAVTGWRALQARGGLASAATVPPPHRT